MTALDKNEKRIEEGDRVIKEGGDYTLEGEVVSVFCKRSGTTRVIVEDDRGVLMIYAGKNVRKLS